jgi:glycosyltransferase involved in cell wall biosynthesis
MSKPNPLVSICMPAYNADKYITAAINSVIDQSYQNWELIIVNDGSTDQTSGELEKITDSRIKIYNQANKGQCAAANAAFGFSKGDLIKFMDADDLISPDFISEQVKCLNGKHDTIALSAWGRFYNDDLTTFKLNKDRIKHDCKPIDWLVASINNAMMQCARWLIPRSVLNQSGLWDETLSLINDFEFFIRVLLHSEQICYTPNAVLYYRSGIENSLSGLKSGKGIESAYNSINNGTEYMLRYENSIRVKNVVANSLQNFIYTFYPHRPDLMRKAEVKVVLLGGSNLKYPAGGCTKMLQNIIGWKLTVRLKSIFS